MKLTKRLFIDGREYALASHKVSLKLSLGGKALFVVNAPTAPARYDAVRFDIGYDAQTAPFFEGFIDKVEAASNGAFRLIVKERAGVLSDPLPLSLEHPTMAGIVAVIEQKTGLVFRLPEAPYTKTVIPNFVSHGSGYQCLENLGRAFQVPDCVWYQDTDQVIYFGAYEHSHFYQKPMHIPHEFTSRQSSHQVSFVPFPMLRPGRIAFGQRISRLDLSGDEMTAFWTDNAASARKRELYDLLPEVAAGYHLPLLGRVDAVRDHATAGHPADPFRPRFAVDVQVLDEHLLPDKHIPVYRSVPLPVHMSGHGAGLLAYPPEGTLVEIAFAYGRSDLPIIRGLYGRDQALPSLQPGEQLQQQREEVSRRTDAAGNVTDSTDQSYRIRAFEREEQATRYRIHAGQHHLVTDEHSLEHITGKKLIEALGAIELMAGDNLELGSLGNLHLATAGEWVAVIGTLRNIVIAQDDRLKVMGQRLEAMEKDWEASAKNMRFTAGLISLNGGKGLVQGDCICAFTGKPHSDVSSTVRAGK